MFANINKLKQILNLESTQEKLDRYQELEKSYNKLAGELDDLADYFQKSKVDFDLALKDSLGYPERYQATVDRYNEFDKSHREEIRKCKSEFSKIKSEKEKIESDEVFKKSLDKLRKSEAYLVIKKSYQDGKITLESFNQVIKSITKSDVTKYADFILMNEYGDVLLLKRSSWEDSNAGAWVIPGGHVDPGEDFETAALRELREESGYHPTMGVKNCGSYKDENAHIEYFMGHINMDEQTPLLDVFESRDYRWVKQDDLKNYEMVFNMRENVLKILGIEDADKYKVNISKNERYQNILGKYGEGIMQTIEEALKNRKQKAVEEDISKSEDLVGLYADLAIEMAKMSRKRDFLIEKGFTDKANEFSEEIEKAKKDISKLRKIKKLIYRDGKLVSATYYVKDDVTAEETKRTGSAGIITEDISEGDNVSIKTSRSWISGVVTGFSFHEKDSKHFISIRDDKDDVKWVNVSSIKFFNKTKGSPIGKKEAELLSDTGSISDYKDLELVRSLGGSSGVRLMREGVGKLFAVKTAHKGDMAQLRQEVIMNNVYTALGFKAPESKIDETAEVMISKYISGAKELNSVTLTPELKKEIGKGFVLDCLLANWDVLGAGKDNVLIKDGQVIRVDNGGCLATRAKGGVKSFGKVVSEIETLREHEPGSTVFSGITDEDIKEQVQFLKDNKEKLVKSASALPVGLYDTLMERMKFLEDKYLVEKPKEAPKPKEEKPRAGMPSMTTQKYFDEKYDKLFQINGNKGIKEHIKQHIIDIENKHQKEYEKQASSRGISVSELKDKMQMMVEAIVARSNGYIVVHSSAGSGPIVDAVLSGGRFKSQFETGTSKGSLSPTSRSRTEKGYFGFSETEDPKNMRPIYGFFTDQPNGVINAKGEIPPPRKVSQYGDVCFQVKDSKFRKDATITFSDSLGDETSKTASPAGFPHFTSFDPYHLDNIEEMYSSKVWGSESGKGWGYVESQYHGQLTVDDIEKIHVSSKQYDSDMKKLSKVINEINGATLKGGKLVPIEIF